MMMMILLLMYASSGMLESRSITRPINQMSKIIYVLSLNIEHIEWSNSGKYSPECFRIFMPPGPEGFPERAIGSLWLAAERQQTAALTQSHNDSKPMSTGEIYCAVLSFQCVRICFHMHTYECMRCLCSLSED